MHRLGAPRDYHRLGRVFPRDALREPWRDRRGRQTRHAWQFGAAVPLARRVDLFGPPGRRVDLAACAAARLELHGADARRVDLY